MQERDLPRAKRHPNPERLAFVVGLWRPEHVGEPGVSDRREQGSSVTLPARPAVSPLQVGQLLFACGPIAAGVGSSDTDLVRSAGGVAPRAGGDAQEESAGLIGGAAVALPDLEDRATLADPPQ